MTFPDLLILRHGETEWNRAGRLQGALDSPLTDLGLRQATRQRAILAKIGLTGWQAYCSPQGRAAQTARIALPGAVVLPDPRLREIGLGEWAGNLRDDIAHRMPDLFLDGGLQWYDHAPGGEGFDDLESRARAFLQDLTGPSVLVTHGITSRMIRCVALGMPPGALDTLDGGQGVVHHVRDGQSVLLA